MPCQCCGACCKNWRVPVMSTDNVPVDMMMGSGVDWAMKRLPNGDCIALRPEGCAIYDRRPAACRLFLCLRAGGTSPRPEHEGAKNLARLLLQERERAGKLRAAILWLMELASSTGPESVLQVCTKADGHKLMWVAGNSAETEETWEDWPELLVWLYEHRKKEEDPE